MKILPSLTHPHVVSNLYDFLWNIKEVILINVNQTVLVPIGLYCNVCPVSQWEQKLIS